MDRNTITGLILIFLIFIGFSVYNSSRVNKAYEKAVAVAETDYAKGNFREIKDGRNPVVVWTPTNVGMDSFNIQNPNGQTLSQGISNIVSQFSQTQGGAAAYEHTIY